MNIFKYDIGQQTHFSEIFKNINQNKLPSLVVGANLIHKAHIIFNTLYLNSDKNILVVTSSEGESSRLVYDINSMFGDEKAFLFPSREIVYRDIGAISLEYDHIRLKSLWEICLGKGKVFVASIDSVVQKVISLDRIKNCSFDISIKKNKYTMEDIIKKLVKIGYINRAQVDGIGQFSKRGGILDIYSPCDKNPVRIEFWGDEIDSIAYFDLDSQRREGVIDFITIVPARESFVYDKIKLIKKLDNFLFSINKSNNYLAIEKFVNQDIELINQDISLNHIDKYIPFIDGFGSIFDYFNEDLVFILEYGKIKERFKSINAQYIEDLKILTDENQICRGFEGYIQTFDMLDESLKKSNSIYLDNFLKSYNNIKFKGIINLNCLETSSWSGDIKVLYEQLKDFKLQGYTVVVLAITKKAAKNLVLDLEDMGIKSSYYLKDKEIISGEIYIKEGYLSSGFEYPDCKFSVITSKKEGKLISSKKSKKTKGEEIKSLSDLQQGDIVVHVSHGIGIFDGVNKIKLDGIIKDYIKLKYAGADTLYLPVTQLDLVSKYIGPKDETRIKLNRLNSGEWNKTRSRVKQAVDDMAKELIKIYSDRIKIKGFAFSEDCEMQRDFESHFEYEETDDQLRCIEEIKKDMESINPMDRVLCGDVGFGKTEVSIRGAFKAVLDGKQCALLCPTTILAWQHYKTIKKRIGNFPIKVSLLSRFKNKKEQKQVLERLESGEIDIVIGTHRLVQKDVKFKDLGLAIIDEEQRFGVLHKEKFKEFFIGVDQLSLSATPIPRTLNMAMSGIRDMSIIEQAPRDRLPIQTYVMEHNIGIIIDAINKEMRRGGQVFYIHNRVETIDSVANSLIEQVPDCRIGIAHGRMGEDDLAKVWKGLIDKEIDVLVCTTIIETGVDIANCNTLIIEDADRMGLSQLYQLRGRVGRSNRRAYAYFTFSEGKELSDIASKRLSAIKEFTQFGSGHKIALRDLEIRGAGNMLGSKQHGHMEDVGYDMYLKLLSDAIKEQKGEKKDIATTECLIDVRIDAYIPDNYIQNLAQRLDIYRKIAGIKSLEDSQDILDEMIDRFGNIPKCVEGLVDIALLRNTAAKFGFKEISQQGEKLIFSTNGLDIDIVGVLTKSLRGRVLVNAGKNPYIIIKIIKGGKSADVIREVVGILLNIE